MEHDENLIIGYTRAKHRILNMLARAGGVVAVADLPIPVGGNVSREQVCITLALQGAIPLDRTRAFLGRVWDAGPITEKGRNVLNVWNNLYGDAGRPPYTDGIDN